MSLVGNDVNKRKTRPIVNVVGLEKFGKLRPQAPPTSFEQDPSVGRFFSH